ncbi:NADPH-dependent 2,4-dienoyl-CoA reductase/sulfur reductase-like enzyme [Bradyrhizobium liaoningense]
MTGLVIIGASYAGVQAALTARDAGYSQPITIVCDEEWLPYQRPPLSKDFLLGRISEQNLILRDEIFFEGKQINLVLGQRATLLDLRARQVTLAGDNALEFEKLLIATGSRARRIAVEGADFDGISYLRSVTDAIDLKARLADAPEIVIIGGGFIGLEVAASAAKLWIPTKPAMHSNSKPAGYSDLKPATRGVVRMGQFHDVVEGWEGQETG